MRLLFQHIRFVHFTLIILLFLTLEIFSHIGNSRLHGHSFVLKDDLLNLLPLVATLFVGFVFSNRLLSKGHSYLLFFFLILTFGLSYHLTGTIYFIGYFFVLIGLGRISELPVNTIKKGILLDSSFCFAMASAFVPEFIFLMFLPWMSILLFCPLDVRNWFIPLFAFLAFWILKSCYLLWIGDPISFRWVEKIIIEKNFAWTIYHLTVIGVVFILILFNLLIARDTRFQKIKGRIQLSTIIMIMVSLVWIIISTNWYEQLILLSFPLSLSFGYLFEYIRSPDRRQIILTGIVLLCLALKAIKVVTL